jgi:hypothetical protein
LEVEFSGVGMGDRSVEVGVVAPEATDPQGCVLQMKSKAAPSHRRWCAWQERLGSYLYSLKNYFDI